MVGVIIAHIVGRQREGANGGLAIIKAPFFFFFFFFFEKYLFPQKDGFDSS